MRQTRKNARIITDYYVNMKFKVRFGNRRDSVYYSGILCLEHNAFYCVTMLTLLKKDYCVFRIKSKLFLSFSVWFVGIFFPVQICYGAEGL